MKLLLDTHDPIAAAGSHGFSLLSISAEHARRAAELPPLHDDPFDRILVAQASIERMTLVSGDAFVHSYSVPTLWS